LIPGAAGGGTEGVDTSTITGGDTTGKVGGLYTGVIGIGWEGIGGGIKGGVVVSGSEAGGIIGCSIGALAIVEVGPLGIKDGVVIVVVAVVAVTAGGTGGTLGVDCCDGNEKLTSDAVGEKGLAFNGGS